MAVNVPFKVRHSGDVRRFALWLENPQLPNHDHPFFFHANWDTFHTRVVALLPAAAAPHMALYASDPAVGYLASGKDLANLLRVWDGDSLVRLELVPAEDTRHGESRRLCPPALDLAPILDPPSPAAETTPRPQHLQSSSARAWVPEEDDAHDWDPESACSGCGSPPESEVPSSSASGGPGSKTAPSSPSPSASVGPDTDTVPILPLPSPEAVFRFFSSCAATVAGKLESGIQAANAKAAQGLAKLKRDLGRGLLRGSAGPRSRYVNTAQELQLQLEEHGFEVDLAYCSALVVAYDGDRQRALDDVLALLSTSP